MFYVTHCSRHVQPDSYEHGLEYPGSPDSFWTEEKLCLHGPTLADAIDRALEYYGLPKNYTWWDESDASGEYRRFTCNRQESEYGCDATPAELDAFKAGSIVLYLVDYDFAIEWRDVRGVSADDLASLRTARPAMQVEAD